jgi:acrylyl-CoA reductase (NADPH)
MFSQLPHSAKYFSINSSAVNKFSISPIQGDSMFKAILIKKDEQGYRAELSDINDDQLPEGDVTVKVDYSTLNYKDGLAITGKGPVVRSFPMIPGIDFSGRVENSNNILFKTGDKVILNGWGVGETHWGGLAQRARVKGDWLIPLPSKFNAQDARSSGTAGYTAMLCVMALENAGVKTTDGDILVTGANGGVGSFAIAILSKLGYRVVASTGRPEESAYLNKIGASEIIDRATLSVAGKPLQKERWAAAVDTVGSHTLANVCASLHYGGTVAACGMAQGLDLPASVAPFILRNIQLQGIDSVQCPKDKRIIAWDRLASDLQGTMLNEIGHLITLKEAIPTAAKLLNGEVRGRVVVDVNA